MSNFHGMYDRKALILLKKVRLKNSKEQVTKENAFIRNILPSSTTFDARFRIIFGSNKKS